MKILNGVLIRALFFLTLSLGGCAMTQPGVLTFDKHNLFVDCYSASDVKVAYGAYRTIGAFNREYKPEHRREIARAKQPSDDTRFLSGTMGPYRSFEGPLIIQWHALDDSVIDTTINLDEVFPNKVIPHKEDPSRIYWPIPTTILPCIVIEVNDRTLNIYSDVAMSLLPEDHNASKRISKRNRTLVFSKTY